MELWIVGQLLENEDHTWQFVGVFDAKDKADAACTTENHFLGPATLNRNHGEPVIEWPGAVFPRIEMASK